MTSRLGTFDQLRPHDLAHLSHFRSEGRRVKVESHAFSSKTWKVSSVVSFTFRPPCPKGKCAWYQAEKTQLILKALADKIFWNTSAGDRISAFSRNI